MRALAKLELAFRDDRITGAIDGREVVVAAPPAFEPAVLLATVGDQSVTLRWTPVPDASSYRLRVSTKADDPFEQEFNVGRTLTHTFRHLRNGTLYYFWAQAVNSAGSGDPSYAQVATPGR